MPNGFPSKYNILIRCTNLLLLKESTASGCLADYILVEQDRMPVI